jgi:putative ABC transport system permease protein
VLALVLRDGMKLVVIGLALGLLGSVGAGRVIASQLYRVNGLDPLVLGGVGLALLATAALACWLPARHATRVNPVDALRAE